MAARRLGASGGQVSFEFWQLVTYAFLHGGLSHLAFNMFALYMFGGAIEQVVGTRRYLAYYFVCVVAAALDAAAGRGAMGGVYPTIGASGGVFGLLLAYARVLSAQPRHAAVPADSDTGARVRRRSTRRSSCSSASPAAQAGVAHFAHLGGLVGGAAMLYYWRHARRVR